MYPKVLLKRNKNVLKQSWNTLWSKLFIRYYLYGGLKADKAPCLPIGHAPASCML